MHTILLIDDDMELASMLGDYLAPEGFTLRIAGSGLDGLSMLGSGNNDLVLLDVGLPDTNGFDVLAEIRSCSQVPVIMLTGRAENVDRIVGLEMGADDYLPKPFVPRELLARMRSVLRRSRMARAAAPAQGRQIAIDDLLMDRGARSVHCKGEPVMLTFAEYTILEMLLDAGGNTVSREDISLRALGRELAPYDRSIDVHMSNIRRKLGLAPSGGERIITVRGAGYFYHFSEPAQKPSGPAAFVRMNGGIQ
jgi:two-component system response regulator CpxR